MILPYLRFTQKPAVVAVVASFVAALALWLSRASFDVAGTSLSPQRVAMLPGLPELAGLIVLSLLITAGIAWLMRWDRAMTDVLMPVFGLALLTVPYVPFLADWMPALRLLAGPGRVFIWVIVVGQVLWLFAHELFPPRPAKPADDARQSIPGALVIFSVSLAAYGWALWRLNTTQEVRWPAIGAGAAIAALTWLWTVALTRSKAAATFSWASVFLSAPFVLNSGEIAPRAFLEAMAAIRQLPVAKFTTLAASGPGLLFDQEFGIVPYAPVLMLALVGLAGMLRDPAHRPLGIALSAAALVLTMLGGVVDPWWNESIMPGRRVLLLLPVLAPPLAWFYTRAVSHPLLRSGIRILILTSLCVTAVVVLAASDVPLPQEGDGSSSIFQWMSPTWHLWLEAPSYVATSLAAAHSRTALWIAAFALACWLFSRKTALSPGRAALRATVMAVALSIAVASAGAALPVDGRRSSFDPEARVLFPLLERFDPIARPIAVRYDPFSVEAAEDLAPIFALSAVPEQRLSRQPLRVVLNARFRLPAGEYELDVTGSELAGTVEGAAVGLQIGREGRALEMWPLALAPGGHMRRRFRVPLDAEFVGFRAAREVERTIAALRVTAVSVVPTRLRFQTATVRSAASFGAAKVFFHDSASYPETEGIWIKGATTARMTLMKPHAGDEAVFMTMHSGARPNAVTLSTGTWSERFDLVPGVTAKLTVPSKAGEPFIPLAITSASGFVPAEIDGGRDRRLLGAWVSFIPGDISRTSAAP